MSLVKGIFDNIADAVVETIVLPFRVVDKVDDVLDALDEDKPKKERK